MSLTTSPHAVEKPAATAPLTISRAASPTTIRRSMPNAAAAAPMARCAATLCVPSSAIRPSTAKVRPTSRRCTDGRKCIESCAHRLGVRVVCVVDDSDAVGAFTHVHAPAALRSYRPSADASASTSKPASSATAAAASAFDTWCAPCSGQLDRRFLAGGGELKGRAGLRIEAHLARARLPLPTHRKSRPALRP